MSHETFVPVIRSGLSVFVTQDAAGQRASLSVGLQATASGPGGEKSEPVTRAVELYGPGDIVGFDPRIVTRTDPKADIGDAEPEYFVAVDFADEDFVTRHTHSHFSTDKGGGRNEGWPPWITLIVLEMPSNGEPDEFELRARARDDACPSIVVRSAASLPDLDFAWRWAHAHVTGDRALNASEVAALLKQEPERGVSRLLCTRRLKPRTRYAAFVVPTFAIGVDAALPSFAADRAAAPAPNAPAWIRANGGEPVTIPYYYRFDFGTSQLGGFEFLARLLEARKLTAPGSRPVDCGEPGFVTGVEVSGVAPPENRYLAMEGALRAEGLPVTAWGKDQPGGATPAFQTELAAFVNDPEGGTDAKAFSFSAGANDEIANIVGTLQANSVRVEVRWTTAVAATGYIRYGAKGSDEAGWTQIVSNRRSGVFHRALLKGLKPGATYGVSIVAKPENDPTAEADTTGELTLPSLPRVVPPIYGRWHAAVSAVSPTGAKWVHHLNLDPRHRAAAGLGAEVVRKHQEALMASAWDQLGAVQEANEVLRRAQLGRDAGRSLHERLGRLDPRSYVSATRVLHQRVLLERAVAGDASARMTATKYVASASALPAGALDRAFRRIVRPSSPVRKRQQLQAPLGEVFERLAAGPANLADGRKGLELAGPPPTPMGTTIFGDITRSLAALELGDVPANLGLVEEQLDLSAIMFSSPAADEVELPLTRAEGVAAVRSLGTVAQLPRAPVSASSDFFAKLKTTLHTKTNPERSVLARVKQRLPTALRGNLVATGHRKDPLDSILVCPTFDQPMYEPLRDLSHEFLLPCVGTIPQNTVAILETNSRFIESYLVGCNHELAVELLWRGYPTDQRGSCFRQFWDISAYVPRASDLDGDELKPAAREALRDANPLHKWKKALGKNGTELYRGMGAAAASLVLIVRGDLLRRYPDTLIYAVDAVQGEDGLIPALPEFDEETSSLQFPLFRAALPPDITFFGFPFDDAYARSKVDPDAPHANGTFFIIEQRTGALRWGLDERAPEDEVPNPLTISDWAWQDFGLGDERGKYLDDATTTPAEWTATTSSAFRAANTLQQPVRIAIHADQMLPRRNE